VVTLRLFPFLGRSLAVAMVLLLLTACGGESQAPGGGGSGPEATASSEPEEPQLIDLSVLGFNEGSEATAVIGLIEFADFGCIYCAEFHRNAYGALQAEFVDSGDILWKYVPITIGGFPNGELAGLAGECAGELSMLDPMREILFERQVEWMGSNQGTELFVQYAMEAGLNAEAFRSCLTGDAVRRRLEANNRMAREVGVTGTPSFIVNGALVRGAPPLDAFQDALRRLVAEARGPQPFVPAAP